jgi:hypothetical protein
MGKEKQQPNEQQQLNNAFEKATDMKVVPQNNNTKNETTFAKDEFEYTYKDTE